ncbi:type IV toxin-antitoxin system AbiEi family antitoxin [Hymenobacter bucti]|uniref:Type IV toxin-antitoxin system AbiEi family antitoxin n=1 Tax=Hymenobacter bucti TaxID=1844114 RepID=A0ABW4R0X5_9BACT
MATLPFSSTHGLLEQVRQCLQRRLALPVRAWAASQPEAQVWQIGAAVRLLATPAGPGPVPPSPPAADYPPLLVYDHVPQALGAQLRARGTSYADAAGNAWLQHLELLAGAPASEPALAVSSPAWHVQLLRLLFQLVLTPALAASAIPRLAASTQLPVAVVRQLLRSLAAQGFWHPEAPLGVSPLLLPAPARYWLAHYASTLRRRLNGQRYRSRCPTPVADWAQRGLPAECLWSGEAAAHLLLGCPAPPTSLTLYSQLPRPQLVQQLDLVPSPKGAIEILNAFAPATCFAPTDPRCVPPLLVYADLLTSEHPPHQVLAQALHARYLSNLLA